MSTPIYTLIRYLATLAKKRDTNAILAYRELKLKDKLLNTYQKRARGKKVALEGKFLLTTDKIL